MQRLQKEKETKNERRKIMDKETVAQARKESNEAYLIYATLKIPYLKAEENWLKKLYRFKEFDYQLAQIGRAHV